MTLRARSVKRSNISYPKICSIKAPHLAIPLSVQKAELYGLWATETTLSKTRITYYTATGLTVNLTGVPVPSLWMLNLHRVICPKPIRCSFAARRFSITLVLSAKMGANFPIALAKNRVLSIIERIVGVFRCTPDLPDGCRTAIFTGHYDLLVQTRPLSICQEVKGQLADRQAVRAPEGGNIALLSGLP
jgi:hypothetical protein